MTRTIAAAPPIRKTTGHSLVPAPHTSADRSSWVFGLGVVERAARFGRLLIGRDGCLPHDEFGDHGGDESRNDEAGSPGGFRDEHDCGKRHPVARTEERSDADNEKQ